MSAAADSYTQLAMLHAAENAKSFEEVCSREALWLLRAKLGLQPVAAPQAEPPRSPSTPLFCLLLPQVELDKARRDDRLKRSPEYDEQQGVARDYTTREILKVADST